MARRYRMTPARRAALKKAQAASARKRRRNRRIATGIAVGVGVGGALVARHKVSGSSFSKIKTPTLTKRPLHQSGTHTVGSLGLTARRPYKIRRVRANRTKSASGKSTGFNVSYTGRKGIAGGDTIHAYNHKTLMANRRITQGKKASARRVPFVGESPTKTYGGIPIMSATEFSKPKSVTFPSRIIDQKPFRPNRRKNPLSVAKVQGKTIDSYFHDFDKRHGLQRKRRRK